MVIIKSALDNTDKSRLMKKVLLIVTAVMLLASCAKSPEQKAELLIKEQLQKSLYHPDTYAPSGTQMDSAFAPFDDPAFYQKTLKLAKLTIAANQFVEEANQAKSSMAIWSGPYQTAYDRQSYSEEKAKYDKAMENMEKAKQEAQPLAEELKGLAKGKRVFIGFKAIHSYRANNNAGQTIGGKAEFIFDKDIKNVLAVYDMDSEEYQAVDYIYKMMRGETSMADEVTLDK